MPIDPVCGMEVDEATPHRTEKNGAVHYFCSEHCLHKFLETPADSAQAASRAPAPAGRIYTCPMHPEIEQDAPGTCPKCGMALEPKSGPIEETGDADAELRDMTRRFWIGAVLTLPVFLLAMG